MREQPAAERARARVSDRRKQINGKVIDDVARRSSAMMMPQWGLIIVVAAACCAVVVETAQVATGRRSARL